MTDRNQALFDRAVQVIPGGVNSPVRAFRAVGGTPRFVQRAQGAYFWDANGQKYIDYIADRRLVNCHLEPLSGGNMENPFPWLSEAIDLKKEQNFFEGKVTEYQKASALEGSCSDDDL